MEEYFQKTAQKGQFSENHTKRTLSRNQRSILVNAQEILRNIQKR